MNAWEFDEYLNHVFNQMAETYEDNAIEEEYSEEDFERECEELLSWKKRRKYNKIFALSVLLAVSVAIPFMVSHFAGYLSEAFGYVCFFCCLISICAAPALLGCLLNEIFK